MVCSIRLQETKLRQWGYGALVCASANAKEGKHVRFCISATTVWIA